MRVKLPFLMLLLVSVIMLLPSTASGVGQWVKYSGNPVLSPTPGGWDNDYVICPRALYDGKVYRLWYDGGSTGVAAIGFANSTDGITWKKYSSPVLSPGGQGAWDGGQVALGSVFWNGTLFLMWYGGSNTTTNSNGAVGFATSKDGISWTKYSGNPVLKRTQFSLDQSYMATPYVIKLITQYWMWYTGKNTTYPEPNSVGRILAASSYDGTHWTKLPSPALTPSTNASWDSGSLYSPSVIFDGSNFGLWYTGSNQNYTTPQIGLAISPTGGNWTRSPMNPILSVGGPGSWDSAGVEQPSVIIGGSGYMLYYDGFSNNTGGRIGLAIAPQNFAIPEFSASPLDLFYGAIICVALSIAALKRHREY